MKSRNIILSLALMGCTAANALTLQQAKKLYSEGEFGKALSTFQGLVKKNPGNASYNQWYGACLYETGRKAEARKYIETAYNKRVTDAARYMAQYALEEMDYEAAADYTDVFADRLGENESSLSATAAKGYNRLKRVSEMLGNVEKVQVFDSLNVDKSNFLKAYKLSKETGSLNSADILPAGLECNTPEVFMPQSANRMVWSVADSTGCVRLAETYRLADGKWDHATLLPASLNDGGDAAYPFVMTDGTTIYFASNGNDSIGGYDIFMSRKDFSTGEYLNPQNIGFPYNSPYDDYMFVIDNDNIYSLAALRDIKATWADDADYASLKESIESISADTDKPDDEFVFYVMNGVRYTRFDNFQSSEARSLMEKRVALASQLADDKTELKRLRAAYANAKPAARKKMGQSILQLEHKVSDATKTLANIDNNIRSAEQSAIDK